MAQCITRSPLIPAHTQETLDSLLLNFRRASLSDSDASLLNSTKLAAISSSSYEQFQAKVAARHLKPVVLGDGGLSELASGNARDSKLKFHAKHMQTTNIQPLFATNNNNNNNNTALSNTAAPSAPPTASSSSTSTSSSSSSSSSSSTSSSSTTTPAASSASLPPNINAFMKAWGSFTDAAQQQQRYEYLTSISPVHFAHLLRSGPPSTLLPSIFLCCDGRGGATYLLAFGNMPSFGLAIQMMRATEKAAAKACILSLESIEDDTTMKLLKEKYKSLL